MHAGYNILFDTQSYYYDLRRGVSLILNAADTILLYEYNITSHGRDQKTNNIIILTDGTPSTSTAHTLTPLAPTPIAGGDVYYTIGIIIP